MLFRNWLNDVTTRCFRRWRQSSDRRTRAGDAHRSPAAFAIASLVERLEDRTLLSAFSESGTILTIDLAASQTVQIVSAGSTYTLTTSSGTWSGTNSANVTGNGATTLTVTTAGLAAFDVINITDSGTGAAVTFNNSGANNYTDTINVNLDNSGAGQIAFNGTTSFAGSAALTASTNRNVVFNSGAVLKSVDGNLTLNANVSGSATGNFIGLQLNAAKIETTGTGNIAIVARASGAGDQDGFQTINGGIVRTANGHIDITGTSTDTGESLQFGQSGTGNVVESTGSGEIRLTGTSGLGAFAVNQGAIGHAAGTGTIIVTADTAAAAAGFAIRGTGHLVFKPFTANTTIGVSGGAGTLNISDTLINTIANGFSSITIGDATNGVGAVTLNRSTFNDPVKFVGASIIGTPSGSPGNIINMAGGDLLSLSGMIQPGSTTNNGLFDIDGGSLTITSAATTFIEIDGTAGAGVVTNGHDQIDVAGNVTLGGGLDLNVTDITSGEITIGATFTIVRSSGTISGTFVGLPDGATVKAGVAGDNIDLVIDYQTNAVVIQAVAPPALSDYGDAPDATAGTGTGNYTTAAANKGPAHRVAVIPGLFLGDRVDSEVGTTENAAANADDKLTADDEDGVLSPLDLVGTVGAAPTVTLLATNTVGMTATLFGWIDVNRDGVFDNATERAQATVNSGTIDGRFTLTFPIIPDGSAGKTYARFRLSTDSAAANSTGAASNGEVEDYVFSISSPSIGTVGSVVSSATAAPFMTSNAQFGTAIAALGDLDGDGVGDLVVSSPTDNAGRGALFVEFLNANGSVKNFVKLNSSSSNAPALANQDLFGSSIALLGDLDGDGIPEIAVGATGDDTGGTDCGAVYILRLKADGSIKSTVKIASSTNGGPALLNNDGFGSSLASLGDLDGDGIVDLAVGATGDDTGGSNRGAVYVLFLNADGSAKSSMTQKIAHGTANVPALLNEDFFGSSVAAMSDLDGDGVTELAVGAKGDQSSNVGAVYVLRLNSNGSVNGTTKISNSTGGGPVLTSFEAFGTSLAAIGDVNSDGITDLLVGSSPYNAALGYFRGAAYVLRMNADGTVKSSTKIASGTNGGPTLKDFDLFGSAVTAVGDLNADGVTDLVVGASGFNSNRGAVYVLFPTAAPTPAPVGPARDYGDAPDTNASTGMGNYQTLADNNGPSHVIVSGLFLGKVPDADDGTLQNTLASADDLSANGRDDEDGTLSPLDLTGTVGAAPTMTVLVTNTTGATATLSGWIDYNRDGVFDNSTERAQATINTGTTAGRITLTFPAIPNGSAGTTYARLRLSTDSAAQNSTGSASDGEVEDYTFSITAPTGGALKSTAKLSGTSFSPFLVNDTRFGSSVASLGDVDGDGIGDVLIGANSHQDTSTEQRLGAVRLVRLNANGSSKASNWLTSTFASNRPALRAFDLFGDAVTSLGDVDGDGGIEIVVGAPSDDNSSVIGAVDRGAVYVLSLDRDFLIKSFTQILGGQNGGPALANSDFFGGAIANIGDVNGDGVNDLAVGAHGDDTGGAERGAVYILMMKSDGTVLSSTKIASGLNGGPNLSNSDFFGRSLAALGDLDNDGIVDLAVGAFGDSTGGSGRGAVHLLLLNANGTVKSSTKIASGAANAPTLADGDSFGSSIAAADVSGDGVVDLIVGAFGDDTGGADRGAVHVLRLNADGSIKSTSKIASGTANGPTLANGDTFGTSVSVIGDLDGDGVTELLVGASRDDTGGENRGAAYVVSLSPIALPQVSFGSTSQSVNEDAGTIHVTVRLDAAQASNITVPLTFSGSATSPGDFTSVTSVVIPAGQTSVNVPIDIVNDAATERVETIQIEIGTLSGAVPASPTTHSISIADNDAVKVGFSSSFSQTVNEGEISISITATLQGTALSPTTVPIIVSGTATSGSDFTVSGNSEFTFPAGVANATATVTLTIADDGEQEASETIVLTLGTPDNAALLGTNQRVQVTLNDNDRPQVEFVSGSSSSSEAAGTSNVRLVLSVASPVAIDVTLQRESGTATSGTDFSPLPTTVRFEPGQTIASLPVTITNDSSNETSETIGLLISGATNAAVGAVNRHTLTIIDNDPLLTFVAAQQALLEGQTGSVTINLSQAVDQAVTVRLTPSGTAVSTDYTLTADSPATLVSGLLTIPAGQTSATVRVAAISDSTTEATAETATLMLSTPIGALLGATITHTATISEPSKYVQFAASAQTVAENVGTVPVVVSLGSVFAQNVAVSVTFSGTAKNGASSDWTGFITSVTIPAGQMQASFDITVRDDTLRESSETIIVTMKSPTSGATLGSPATFTLTITDNDSGSSVSAGNAYLNQSTVFFDANRNGVLDFVDANGNGSQDDGELSEPSALTGADGGAPLIVGLEFDRNSDGTLDHLDGIVVVTGGVDTSTGFGLAFPLIGYLETPVISPLTTVLTRLVEQHGFTVSEAADRIASAFGLPNTRFSELDPLAGIGAGDADAPLLLVVRTMLADTLKQLASAASAVPNAPSLAVVADALVSDMASRIVDAGSTLDLQSASMIEAILRGTLTRTGGDLSNSVVVGVAQIVAATNQQLANIPIEATPAFLEAVIRTKAVAQGSVTADLQSAADGSLPIEDVIGATTGDALDAAINNAIIGVILPPKVSISDASITEGESGSTELTFTVSISEAPTQPVSVSYSTADNSATTDGGDYLPASDTLSWEIGDSTPKTITISVLGDTDYELDELLTVLLSNPTNAILDRDIGLGSLINDDPLNVTAPVGAGIGGSGTQQLTLRVSGGQLELVTPEEVLASQIGTGTRPITITGTDAADDTLIIHFVLGSPIPTDGLTFSGGTGGFDTAQVIGGQFASITQTLTNATDGTTTFDTIGSSSTQTFEWFGLEPFLLNVGSVTDLVFNLPNGGATAILEDADPTDENPALAGMMQLRSQDGHFETTTFVIPTGSLTINGGDGDDSITIASVDPAFAAALTIDGLSGTDTIHVQAATGSGARNLVAETIDFLSTPAVTSIDRVEASPTNADEVSFVVTFNDNVSGISTSDFMLATTGSASGTIASVSATSGNSVTVTVNSITGDGTLGLNFDTDAAGGVTGSLGNASSEDFIGATFEFDNTAPTATIVVANDSLTTFETSLVTITFSEVVTGFTNADLTVANGTLSTLASIDGGRTWTATLTPTVGVTDATNVITLDTSGVSDSVGNVGNGTTESNNYAIASSTSITISGGTTTISDTGLTNDAAVLRIDGDNLIVSLSGNDLVFPLAGLTMLVINGGSGDDTLTLDLSGGALPFDIVFHGGAGGHDSLEITGLDESGQFDAVTADYSNAHDGRIDLRQGSNVRTSIAYSGLEPITIEGTPDEIIFNLPGTNDTDVRLLDIGGADGVMRLTGSTFETTDFSIGAATSIIINANAGNDRVTIQSVDAGYSGQLIVNGGTGNDTLIGSAYAESFNGGAGNDSILAGGGDDTLRGDAGNDRLDGQGGVDRIVELANSNLTLLNSKLTGAGTDTLANVERAELTGGAGSNLLDASGFTLGPVTLHGSNGNDTLSGTSFGDTFDGGVGFDTVHQRSSNHQTLVGSTSSGSLTGAGDDLLTSMEAALLTIMGSSGRTLDASGFQGVVTLEGGSGHDTLVGGTSGSVLNGNSGNDSLVGGNGSDSLLGGAGNDTLEGNDGNDVLRGHAGNDRLTGGRGDDNLYGDAGTDKLFGGDGNDLLDSGDGNDTLTGEAGDDIINGGAGNDAINGGNGDDLLNGGSGNDTILGGNGNDRITAGGGNDKIGGGTGDDRIQASGATISTGPGDDSIIGSKNRIDEVFIFDFDRLLV